MGLFFYTKKGSIISTVDLPTTEIIEPNISDCLVILENVLDELRRRKKEVFDEEGNFISEPTEPINLLIYGQNILLKDSRFETLMSEITPFTGHSDLQIYSYAAYLD